MGPRRGRSRLSGCEKRECAQVLALSKGDLPLVSALGFFVLSHGLSFVKSQSHRERVSKRERERVREIKRE